MSQSSRTSESRRTLVIGLMLAALGALLVWLRQPLAKPEIVDTRVPAPVAVQQVPPPAVTAPAAPAQPATAAPAAAAAVEETVGNATSTIHFERIASKTRKAAQINVNAQFAVGVWQPVERRLRVLLLENAPKPGEAAQFITVLQSSEDGASPVTPAGVIDMRFVAAAQAFDRSELERASLTVTNARGDRSTADVLGSLEWHGSLPSPEIEEPPPVSRLQMSAFGSGESQDGEAWKQEWRFNVTVPVVLLQTR
jgi:hypothetical protein